MELFVFPLVNVTLFPKTTKPLNIFEPRYIKMVKDAVEKDQFVAIGHVESPAEIVPVSPGESLSFVNPVVGYGRVQIVEERANGFLLVFLVGVGKARIGKVLDTMTPYYVCDAKELLENQLPDPKLLPKIKVLNKMLVTWLGKYFGNPMQTEMFIKNLDGPEAIISAFTAYLVKDYDFQQMVLELDDINKKIELLYRLVESNEVLS
ncbi:MAG: LON peptidase substrate-binding domain-containing protein [Bdellovibrionaceae bacterium]|nr:LON peptidase substrate-binding domain-containing protein [Pseudobdellovibrionaceae bacterium]